MLYQVMLDNEPDLVKVYNSIPVFSGFSRSIYEGIIGEALMIERMKDIDNDIFSLEFPVDRVIENGYLRMVPVYKKNDRILERVEIRYKRGGTYSELDALGQINQKVPGYSNFILACEAKSGKCSTFSVTDFERKVEGLRSFFDGPFAGILHVPSDYRLSKKDMSFENHGGKIIMCRDIKTSDIKDMAHQLAGRIITSKRNNKSKNR